ncbi:MAG: GAF domain-containing protein, partial [Armatimonadota bacterium]|nr:GAF domain-containing protein [Armatimonadota bacterium]
LVQTLPVDLVLVDLDSEGAQEDDLPERVRACRSHCCVVAVLPSLSDGAAEGAVLAYDATVRADATHYELNAALAKLLERERLLEQIEQLRAEVRRLQARGERLQAQRAPSQPVDKVLKAFSRALSSGFDQERLLNLFADTVLEMMRVSKVSVLLRAREPGEYRVRCFRGLRPDVAAGIRLRIRSGLAAWLYREGRIMTSEMAQSPGIPADVHKEMEVLQATVSIPMLCSGVLVGVLNLNARVTGSPFQEDELETLFTLASHMAVAVQEMSALRYMRHQKDYVEQILAHMNSGVITIDEREHVVTCNLRAAEIIGRDASELLERDLRCLPSPLGDMLFESMTTGRRYRGEEIALMPGRVPIEASVYRIEGSDGRIMGSVAIFDDLRPRQEMERRKQEAERAELLNRVLARLAAEVRGPVGRIQELCDSLPRAVQEGEAFQSAREALHREVQRLRLLGDELAVFTGDLRYAFDACPIREVVEQAIGYVREEGVAEQAVVLQQPEANVDVLVRADAAHLSRALSYLLCFAAEQANGHGPVQVMLAKEGDPKEENGRAEIRIRYAPKAGSLEPERVLQSLAGPEGFAAEAPNLGLPIGRRVIEDHGGMLAVSSEGEDGVCISVKLPAIRLPGAESLAEAASA